jgi:hypothetical protein
MAPQLVDFPCAYQQIPSLSSALVTTESRRGPAATAELGGPSTVGDVGYRLCTALPDRSQLVVEAEL